MLDAKTYRTLLKDGISNPLKNKRIIILSYHYAARIADPLKRENWDLVVFDEAHKLRNSYRTSNKIGQKLRITFASYKKLLLTATPLQNSLMELYGLSTLIDDKLFGDEDSFRKQYVSASDNLPALRKRLSGFVKRTLRKDVLEYIRYTKRQAITVPFLSSEPEEQLYEGISALLRREKSYALPANQRHLTGLILRKLLASSSRAVSNTLKTMLLRLKQLEQSTFGKAINPIETIESILEAEDFSSEYLDELDTLECEENETIDLELLRTEIIELEQNIQLADSIATDSKSNALLTGLSLGLAKLEEMGALKKVLVFTESKRTQDYLFDFLEANGYQNQVISFNGTNTSAKSTEVYQQWQTQHAGSDRITGSPQIDRRTALIDHFRDHAMIMLATEAAAEGVNLQFCSQLINYDLPWNPQRVEQRIGRCHRYGQKFDVVVVNFLNESNQADRRVLELLTEKFRLFDGVFGASDEVLGRIESGIDFEKRIEAIYNTCRLPEEIDQAFADLREELESQIEAKMQETRDLLLENFDEDVHSLLKVQLHAAEERLDRLTQYFWKLSQAELNTVARFTKDAYSFQLQSPFQGVEPGFFSLVRQNQETLECTQESLLYRISHPLGQAVLSTALLRKCDPACVRFLYSSYAAKVSVLEELLGKNGFLVIHKIGIESLERLEERLIFSFSDDAGFLLDGNIAEKMLQLDALIENESMVIPGAIQSTLHLAMENSKQVYEQETNQKNLVFFEREVEKLDDWADDLKDVQEQEIKNLDVQIKQVRREAKAAPSLEEKLARQKEQRTLEQKRSQLRRELFQKQDEIDANRDRIIGDLEGKLSKSVRVCEIFRIQWMVV